MAFFNKNKKTVDEKLGIHTTQIDSNGKQTISFHSKKEMERNEKLAKLRKNNPKYDEDKQKKINELKGEIDRLLGIYQSIVNTASDTKNTTYTNGKKVTYQGKQILKSPKIIANAIRNDLVPQLRKLGVDVDLRTAFSNEYKAKYIGESVEIEGGYDKMTREQIKNMRLEVYEDASAGKISDNLKEYMLTYLEYVDLVLQQGEAYTEAVSNIIEQKRSEFIEFVDRSYELGNIDTRQRDVMLEMSGEDFMFETPTPDMIPDLVIEYLEAAKEGDEDKKEEIKEKLDTAKELEKVANQETDEVTEAACESLKDKIKELKIKLSDEEKKIVERLDEKMQNAMGCDSEEDEEESDDSEEKSEESSKEEKSKKEEAPVEESVEQPVARFSSVSGLTDKEKKDAIKFLKESADDGIYTQEELERVLAMLK